MAGLKKIEDSAAKIFKDLPQLPESTKEGLANVWPWLALIGGILQLMAAWALWRLASWADRVTDLAKSISVYYSGYTAGPSSFDKTIIYVGAAILVVEAVIMLMAFPKLQKRQRGGWDLLFLAGLINLVYGVVQIFTFERGIGSFVMSLIGSAVVFYLLFQVREKFGGKTTTPKV